MIRRALGSLQLRALDAADRLRGRADPLVPPRRLSNWVGDSDFRATGDEFMRYFVDLAGLRPDARVLDVGSGIGRVARPLATYLRPPGCYEGFDVVPEGVAWCQRAYRAHRNFGFRVAEVTNSLYRPDSGVPAEDYVFPYAADSFDFSVATSVFTHLLPHAADRYLGEMGRVTQPEGRLLLTFYVFNGAPPGAAAMSFPHHHGHFATASAEVPEAAVAYDETWLRDRLQAHGLVPVEPLRYGTWSGRTNGLSLQDIVIARGRPGSPHPR
jgi:SAM-dependent methyltransferase